MRRTAPWAALAAIFLAFIPAPAHAGKYYVSSSSNKAKRATLVHGVGTSPAQPTSVLDGARNQDARIALAATRDRLAQYGRMVPFAAAGAIALAFASALSTQDHARRYDPLYGPNKSKRAVLTYDDCPKSLKQYKKALRSARNQDVGIVLAPTGSCLVHYKRKHGVNLARLARRQGHYVINHSVSHPNLTKLSRSAVRRQLRAPGVVTNYGRPPYGATNSRVRQAYAAQKMRIWLWTVDTNDWRGQSRKRIVKHVVSHTKKRGTVLMHMQHRGFSPGAIKALKRGLHRRGIKLCRPYKQHGKVATAPRMLPRRLPC